MRAHNTYGQDFDAFCRRQAVGFAAPTLKARGYELKALVNDPDGMWEVCTPDGNCVVIRDEMDLAAFEVETRKHQKGGS